VQPLVDVAFTPYIERIGRPSGPMTTDYARALADSRVWIIDGVGRLDAVAI
jgi:hypothetical protein